MRYERIADIVRLAIRLQSAGGLTLDDIGSEFEVSRRTAERMRNAVEHAFGPLEYEDGGDGKRHWRLRSNALRDLIRVSADELVELETAAAEAERAGFDERAALLRDLAGKLHALAGEAERRRIEPDLEALTLAEGLAMRPGPRPRVEPGLLMTLREAIKAGRTVEFRYLSRTTGRRSRQRVQPHGILYGSRAYLVGRSDWTEDMRYWVLANMSEAAPYRRELRVRRKFRSGGIRGPVLRGVPGGTDRRWVAIRAGGSGGCSVVPVPPRTGNGTQR